MGGRLSQVLLTCNGWFSTQIESALSYSWKERATQIEELRSRHERRSLASGLTIIEMFWFEYISQQVDHWTKSKHDLPDSISKAKDIHAQRVHLKPTTLWYKDLWISGALESINIKDSVFPHLSQARTNTAKQIHHVHSPPMTYRYVLQRSHDVKSTFVVNSHAIDETRRTSYHTEPLEWASWSKSTISCQQVDKCRERVLLGVCSGGCALCHFERFSAS